MGIKDDHTLALDFANYQPTLPQIKKLLISQIVG